MGRPPRARSDYAGELLEGGLSENVAALAELADHIAGAHALLGTVDGHRVLRYLRGEARGRAYFHGTLQPIVSLMAAATCPIRFVITKWDLVRGFGEAPDADDATRLEAVLDDVLQLDALEGEGHAATTTITTGGGDRQPCDAPTADRGP